MKRTIFKVSPKVFRSLAAVLLMLVLTVFFVRTPVLAEDSEAWNSGVYHIGDFSGALSQEYKLQINEENDGYIVSTQFDYVVMIASQDSYKDYPLHEYVDAIYIKNSLGYGPNHDGIALGLDYDHETVVVRLFGRGAEIFTRSDVDSLIDSVRSGYASGGYEGAVSAFCDQAHERVNLSGSLTASSGETAALTFDTQAVPLSGTEAGTIDLGSGNGQSETAGSQETSGNEGVSYSQGTSGSQSSVTEQGLPDWYVTDPSTFTDFHNDENEPRLVDLADLLSPQEEILIETRLDRIRQETQQDVVIYTDTTSYGLDNELFEMDFYVYKGYGVGPNFDGLCLFINMDPDNREMVSTAFGKTRDVFTEYSSNQLDDILYDHLTVQDYYGAFDQWMDGVESLLKYGSVHTPEWFRAYSSGQSMESYRETKLVNEIGEGINSSDERKILTTIQELSEKYDTDIVVYLASHYYPLGEIKDVDDNDKTPVVDSYLDLFWKACGYGRGEDKRGILIGIFPNDNSLYSIQVRTYGNNPAGKAKTMSKEAEEQLESATLLNLGSGNYGYNINRYLDFLGRYLRSGRVPHSWFVRGFWAILCALGGLITGSLTTSAAKKKNNVVREATRADANLVNDSFKVNGKQDVFLGSRIDRRYSPRSQDTGTRSSSSSSRSTYSSHSTSSSGRSGSSSRRKF